jgi:PST family polysaccharide transporter
MAFARILRASALLGGASVVVLLAGFARTKVIALTLGAGGVGLLGLFQAFSGNLAALAGWGLATAGVRTVASADPAERAHKMAAVRRAGLGLAVLGLVGGLLCAWPAEAWAFPAEARFGELLLLAFAVPFLVLAGAAAALLQAGGEVTALARLQVVAALLGFALGLPAIWFWGELGIALSVLLAAVTTAACLWRRAARVCPEAARVAVRPADLAELGRLGAALMVSGWLAQLSAYLVRLYVIRTEGLEAAGYYQAAYALAGALPGFVFGAMAADFFPRVSAAPGESEALELVEKQILAALLLGVPLLGGLLCLGPWSLRWLYSTAFDPAQPLLLWMTWGVFLRLFTWPMGFWLLARAAAPQLLAVEVAGAVAMTSLPVLLMPRLGLVGSAVGFFLGSLLHGGLLLWLVRRRAGRHLRPAPLLAALGSAAILLVVQCGAAYDPVLGATLGGLLLLAAGLAAARLYLRGHR